MGGAVLNKNVRPNLLQRRFRLYRPNKVRLIDLELELATLRQTYLYSYIGGGLYHSNQGTVYLSGTFQWEVSDRDYTQSSMSKRGNCQDNTPQESFFGHFKDECPYSKCKDIEELRELVARYSEYYNYERRMWDKGRMMPIEYERYPCLQSQAGAEVQGSLSRPAEERLGGRFCHCRPSPFQQNCKGDIHGRLPL